MNTTTLSIIASAYIGYMFGIGWGITSLVVCAILYGNDILNEFKRDN